MATAAIDLGMSITAQQEGLGDAFLMALAATAGCAAARPNPDDDSVDWTLSSRLPRRPKIDIQVKTWMGDDGLGPALRYPLKIKNYNDLRLSNVVVPRLLILIAIPASVSDWTSCSTNELALRHCSYWASLLDMEEVANETAVTIHVPRANVVTPDSLKGLMKKVNDGVAL